MVSTHLKNISQIWSFPQVVMKIKNMWNHHLAKWPEVTPITSWQTQTYPVSPSMSSSQLLSEDPSLSIACAFSFDSRDFIRKGNSAKAWLKPVTFCLYIYLFFACYLLLQFKRLITILKQGSNYDFPWGFLGSFCRCSTLFILRPDPYPFVEPLETSNIWTNSYFHKQHECPAFLWFLGAE